MESAVHARGGVWPDQPREDLWERLRRLPTVEDLPILEESTVEDLPLPVAEEADTQRDGFIPLPATNLFDRSNQHWSRWRRWAGPLAIAAMVLAGVIGLLLR